MNKIGLLLVLLILLAGCGGTRTNIDSGTPPPTDAADASEPTGLTIPAIGVDVHELDTFGLDNKGNYACPVDPNTVAWNRGGTVPGEPGLALIIASAQGSFQRLSQLKAGDPVYVTRAGGTRLTFRTVDAGARTSSPVLQLAGCGNGTVSAKYAELTPQ